MEKTHYHVYVKGEDGGDYFAGVNAAKTVLTHKPLPQADAKDWFMLERLEETITEEGRKALDVSTERALQRSFQAESGIGTTTPKIRAEFLKNVKWNGVPVTEELLQKLAVEVESMAEPGEDLEPEEPAKKKHGKRRDHGLNH